MWISSISFQYYTSETSAEKQEAKKEDKNGPLPGGATSEDASTNFYLDKHLAVAWIFNIEVLVNSQLHKEKASLELHFAWSEIHGKTSPFCHCFWLLIWTWQSLRFPNWWAVKVQRPQWGERSTRRRHHRWEVGMEAQVLFYSRGENDRIWMILEIFWDLESSVFFCWCFGSLTSKLEGSSDWLGW